MKRLISAIIMTLFLISLPSAYGHGLGFDESPPTMISDRQVSIETTLSPFYVEGVSESQPVFTVRAHDPLTNSTIAGTDFRVVVSLQNEPLLDQRFTSPDGLVRANLVPEEVTIAEVNGVPQSGEAVIVGQDNPVEIRSRILLDGGLYHVAVTLERTSTGLQLDQDRTFDLYVSISKTQDFEADTEQGPQTISVRTYYSEVDGLEYDQSTGRLSFSMPFDWSPQYVNQVPLVHMEVQFPKSIENLQSNGYLGTVNGRDLGPGDVLIDDYSYGDLRVVHFVLNNIRLSSIAETATGNSMDFVLIPSTIPRFPLDLLSTTERYLWQVSWGPELIETGVLTTFAMNIQDPEMGDLVRNSSFTFVITKDGREVHRQHLTSGLGTFGHQYTFSEPGTYRIAAQNINGANETAQLDILVQQGTNSVDQTPPPSGCLIVTAAFGSELMPQVQFLRDFRDNYVIKSSSGSAFMSTFNTVYYSFSPQVADYEREQPWLQATVRAAIYPLLGILVASERAFGLSGGGEVGTVLAGAVASSLIGAVYISPAIVATAIMGKKRIGVNIMFFALLAAAASLATIALSMQVDSVTALQFGTVGFVISIATAASLALSRLADLMRSR